MCCVCDVVRYELGFPGTKDLSFISSVEVKYMQSSTASPLTPTDHTGLSSPDIGYRSNAISKQTQRYRSLEMPSQ